MNSIVKRVLSGAAALGIALSGLALGAASANADEIKQTVDPTEGTITIANQATWFQKEHTFKGYHLASLTGVSAISENGSFKLNPTFNVVTDSAHKDAITAAMNDVKLSGDTYATLGDKFAHKAGMDGDPMSWLTETEQSGYNDSIGYPWGNGKTGAGEQVMRQFANALAKQLKDTAADQTGLKSSVKGYENNVHAGLWLLIDTTTSETLGGSETGSSAILVSSTYKNIPYTETTGDGSTTVKTYGEVRVLGDSQLGHVEVKNSSPAIAKEVVTYDHTSKKEGDNLPVYKSQENPTYNIGDTVTYMLYSRIPIYNGYPYDSNYGTNSVDATKARQFKIQDFASRQLTVNADTAVESVRLVPSGQNVDSDSAKSVLLVKGKDYDVNVETLTDQTWGEGDAKHDTTYNGGQKTVIDFGKYVNYAKDSTSATTGKILEDYNVEVVFKATLNKDAKISDPNGGAYANPNYVNLLFSNSASDCSQVGTDWGGEVNVYTFKFQIKKTSKDGKTLLPGAEFKVKDVNADKYLIKNTTDNSWTYAEDEAHATVFTSGDKGMVTGLDGLKAGQYQVKETKQPDGYSQFNVGTKFTVDIGAKFTQDKTTLGSNYSVGHNNTWGDHTIGTGDENGVIVDAGQVGLKPENGSTDKIIVTIAGNQASQDETTKYQANVWNAKDVSQLPLTGGAGLLMIIAVGVLLFGAAGILAVRSRRAAAARHSA